MLFREIIVVYSETDFEIHKVISVDKMQSYWMLKQVVLIVTTVLWRINTHNHSSAIDYNPSIEPVSWSAYESSVIWRQAILNEWHRYYKHLVLLVEIKESPVSVRWLDSPPSDWDTKCMLIAQRWNNLCPVPPLVAATRAVMSVLSQSVKVSGLCLIRGEGGERDYSWDSNESQALTGNTQLVSMWTEHYHWERQRPSRLQPSSLSLRYVSIFVWKAAHVQFYIPCLEEYFRIMLNWHFPFIRAMLVVKQNNTGRWLCLLGCSAM
jgi:hypothetical protein